MTSLEGFTLFTTGIRISVLVMLIVVLWNSIKATADKADSLYTRVAHNPKVLLGLILTLLVTSVVQVAVEMYDYSTKMGGGP